MGAIDDFIQGFMDGPGKKIRTRRRTVGVDDVHEQGVFLTAQDTYYALANNVTPGAAKSHLGIYNGSVAKVIKLRKLFCINLQIAAVTGVALRFDINRLTNLAVGTGAAIASQKADSTNTALDNGVIIATGGLATEHAQIQTLFPFITTNEEMPAGQAATNSIIQQGLNLVPEGPEVQEYTLRPGEGVHVKQITTSVVGSFGWLLVFTQE